MNPTVPSNLIAVANNGEHVMGFYAMTTVPDRFVSASKLSRSWAAEALPMNLIPTSRNAVDTFKNACRSVETRRRHGTSNKSVEIKVDQATETWDECVYQVTRMVRDKAQRTIDHPKAMRVTFDKHSHVITFEALSKRFPLDELEQAIKEHYDSNGEKVPGSKVRAAIRGLMDHINGINVRKKAGGVYFVPKKGQGELESLTRVLDFIYGDESEVHLIPCANDKYQQQMVQRHFELNVSQEIDEAMSMVADKLVSRRKIRSDALGNLFAKRKQLGEVREEYAKLVGTDLATVEGKLTLLDEQLKALIEKVNS